MRNERRYVYGHSKTLKQIKKEFPFDNVDVDKNIILSSDYTVTFDVCLAYQLRRKGYNALVWGGMYKHKRIFVIEKKRVQMEMPF